MTRQGRCGRLALELVVLVGMLTGGVVARGEEAAKPAYDGTLFQALAYRSIGPYRGGRVTAVSGVPGDPQTYYMGSTGGGVWKTSDAGISWSNVSDEFFHTASVGAIAVAPSDPNVVYVGMGSACLRGNVSPGDGVYRSTDAGQTWTHMGLDDAGQIARIRVHPENPDLVYAAVLGHAFGPSAQRGVFRSKDGGKTWEKVLYVSDTAGAIDLAMDPTNPRILYAAFWEAVRKPWNLISGGPGSGLHRSKDGGDTWEALTDGLPQGVKGRIGVAASAADPGRVWALVEAEDGGLFRSDNGGKSFRRVSADRELRQRAWYYTHVFADPKDANTVYVLDSSMWRSSDGGKNFELLRAPHGDHHDLWINPGNPANMINGNDGGANVTFDAGRSWSTQDNQPTAEIYRVTSDDQFPYWLYGSQQDNTSLAIASHGKGSAITVRDWHTIGGCESGYVAVDPRHPRITYSGCYGGSIGRYDAETGEEREVMPYPELAVGQAAKDLRYRFQWNAPIRLSPHDPEVLYTCSQFVHRSRDEGQTWEVISPDLTRNDPSKQISAGGPITKDNTGVEVYDTIFAFEESPRQAGLLWAGTDDGRVHISRDDGANWTEITPKDMPEWSTVNVIELSPHDPGRAFLAVYRYRQDDFRPFIYRTNDYGKTWTLLTDGKNGIPADHFVRVVREDPERRGLLYAGTEFGMYVSFDDGKRWQSLQLKLPVVPITDLQVKGDDLLVATQGRAFWILDDLGPLREMSDAVAAEKLHLFQPRDAVLFAGGGGGRRSSAAGQNPPLGAVIRYTLAEEPAKDSELRLDILDAQGNVLRSLSNQKAEPQAPNLFARFFPELQKPRKLDAKKGMNEFVWDLRLRDAELVDDAVLWGSARGPVVPPGTYQARLTLGDLSQTHSFQVTRDPRLDVTPEQLEQRYALARATWQKLSETHAAIKRLRDVREQVRGLTERLEKGPHGAEVKEAAKALQDKLTTVEDKLTQTKAKSSQDVLNFPPQLDNQWVALMSVIESAEAPPTAGARQRFKDLDGELNVQLAALKSALDTELPAFSQVVSEAAPGPVIVGESP